MAGHDVNRTPTWRRRQGTSARDLLTLLAALCLPTAAASSETPTFLERLEALRVEHRIPGMSVVVVQDGELLVAVGLGVADIETGRPVTIDTPFNIASVTKPLSGVVAMRLAERGVIDLDEPIADYSQWRDFCASYSQSGAFFARRLQCDPPTHTLRQLLSHTADGEPGTAFSYNPVLFSWGSRPIMAATGQSFSDLVTEDLLEPLGMANSARQHRARPLPEAIAERLARPHRVNEDGDLEHAPPLDKQGDGAAGGIISTVIDLARFDMALDRGELLSPEAREAMFAPTRTKDGAAQPYGVGWWVQTHEGRTLLWHSGWLPDAYSALYLKVPEARRSLIVLANSEGVWWDNPLDEAAVHTSPFAQAFLETFVP